MRVKQATSVALFLMFLLLGQAMTAHLNQIPSSNDDSSLEPSAIVMSSNNTTDSDGDGIYDSYDDCLNGTVNWTSTNATDYDSDGCKDSTEDLDDDNDGVLDANDLCYRGYLGWTSTNSTDWDSDGCKDATEDMDDDNDGVNDNYDNCPLGDTGWTSNSSTDADADGCRDSTEEPQLTIIDSTNNSYNQYSTWNFNYSVSNYFGYIYWNATSENGVFSSSWSTYVYPSSYHSGSQENFYTNGNYTVCASTSSQTNGSNGTNTGNGASDCMVISVYIQPPTLTITNLTNNTNNQNSTWNFSYSVSNYSGNIYWNATSGNGVFYSSWSTYVYSSSYHSGSQENFYTNGNYTVCASTSSQTNGSNGTNTGNGASDCMVISVYIQPPTLTITDSINYSNNQSSTWNFNYSVSNYYGSIYWNATSENGVLYSSWSTYVYSNSYQSTSQENFYTSGNYTVCASTNSQTNGSNETNTGIAASDCIIIVQTYSAPVPCGNSSTLTFSNTASVYTLDQPITFSILVDCGIGENSFNIQGGLFGSYGENGTDNGIEEFQYQGYSVIMPYEITFTMNAVNESGDYVIAVHISNAEWVQWNFTIYGDDDNDGVNDQTDNCVGMYNPNQTDMNSNSVGDACDLDIDGDGIDNQDDVFPNDANESIDTDNDGLGNNADTDDDGDGMADIDDAFPLSPTEQTDFDGDGVGDNLDADDDGDGITDVNDNCPLVANSDQADLDGDNVGTACDGIELTVNENGTIEENGNAIPSIGMVGTVVAISAGFFIAIRREDEE